MIVFCSPACGLALLAGEEPKIHLSIQIVTVLWASGSPFPFHIPAVSHFGSATSAASPSPSHHFTAN